VRGKRTASPSPAQRVEVRDEDVLVALAQPLAIAA
jgi:hypothetical protein